MTKKRILFIIFLDVLLMAGAGYMAWTRYQELQAPLNTTAEKKSWAKKVSVALGTEETAPVVPSTPTATVPAEPVPPAVSPPPEPTPPPVVAPTPKPPPVTKKAAPKAKTSVPKTTRLAKPAPVAAKAPVQSNAKPRLTFTYFNSTARAVQLVGDFNGWTPTAFQRDAAGRWTVSVSLSPGDYSYNLVVDGKTILDPSQKRTDSQGRSLLTVSSATGK